MSPQFSMAPIDLKEIEILLQSSIKKIKYKFKPGAKSGMAIMSCLGKG